ncbi:hypothetical protein [Corynebacterium frankenforstense]|uniref:hypothetical protein n=1 Tax=Corynebacterium frankenforstense TaxID=1230998 RepID=UPI00254ECAA8|nr:hypothetical protein [Corynebacterium frankenforstense]MDK6258866.1 hypothetical protein [Corynebacterium frankenforstense]
MKKTLVAALATAALATGVLAPAANAADTRTGLLDQLNGNIATADCRVVDFALRSTGMVGEKTTRSELVKNLRGVSDDTTLKLISAQSVTAVADRALECGVVTPDPQVALSSQIPGFDKAYDTLTLLSSL